MGESLSEARDDRSPIGQRVRGSLLSDVCEYQGFVVDGLSERCMGNTSEEPNGQISMNLAEAS